MAGYKYTIVFDYTTASDNIKKVSGWTESYWHDQLMDPADNTPLSRLLAARCEILPTVQRISAVRISTEGAVNSAKLIKMSLPGIWLTSPDIPSMALVGKGLAVNGSNILRLTLRGLPDAAVVGGGVDLSPEVDKGFRRIANQLQGWYQRVRDLQAPMASINEISALGVVEVSAALAGLVVNSKVYVQRTQASAGPGYSGLYRVKAVTDATHFTLLHWEGGTAKNGRCRLYASTIGAYNPPAMKIDQVITRKTGRPIFSYRGRR